MDNGNKKSSGFSTLLVIAIIVGAVYFFLGKTTFGETFELLDWNRCEITAEDENYGTVRRAYTRTTSPIDSLWLDLMDAEMRTTKKNLKQKVLDGSYRDLYLNDESGEIWLWVCVNAKGEMFADFCGQLTSYTGAKSVYEKLGAYIEKGGILSMARALPSEGWMGIALYQYDNSGNLVYSTYAADPSIAAIEVSKLRTFLLGYGGGCCYQAPGYRFSVQLWDEAEEYYYINIYDDGNADIPMGDWVYGVYGATNLYDSIIDIAIEVQTLTGM